MSKIVITGGLGYIGTHLCQLYADQKDDEVTVIDNRFIPEGIAQLKKWGIKFVEGDILNATLMNDVLKDCDIVYHLAGITDVAYTNTESDPAKDALIRKVGVEGSKNIIDAMPKKGKIVFPSSHVLFEGLQQETLDVDENHKVEPKLAYSTAKHATEEDLKQSGKNYVICRLGSNYGYGQSMRLKIVGNTFAKMASQNGTMKLFGGGKQYKPLVSVKDVARCLKFLGENKNINNELFHVVNENLRVREIAEMCKKANESVNIIKTDDLVPNDGYTLSNKKLLETGFRFKYNAEDDIREMINLWKTH